MKHIWVFSAENDIDSYFTSKKRALRFLHVNMHYLTTDALRPGIEVFDEEGVYQGHLEKRVVL